VFKSVKKNNHYQHPHIATTQRPIKYRYHEFGFRGFRSLGRRFANCHLSINNYLSSTETR